ncbi:MAG: hypothetical protein KDC87_00215 [Planctomycetes bacterium]|nr:hypothetical protein [Planctomycetota bacterium]MCB9869733.1 hypothetical protein [Planctomycetota bacterium]
MTQNHTRFPHSGAWRCSVIAAALTLSFGMLPGQGTLERGIYTDAKLGFQIKVPQRWTQVPIQVDEKWIVAQFQSNREYEGHVKLDGGFVSHRPVMRVIQFDKEVIKKMVTVERSEDKKSSVRTLRLPYRDYKDYVKRNLSQGGFHFAVEKKDKLAGVPVTIYEVKVEKLAYGGRKHFLAYVFHGTEGVDFAVEFEFLMHHYKKLDSTGLRSIQSFKFLPRENANTSLAGKQTPATFGKILRLDWKKKTAAERLKIRQEIEQARIKKAIAGLPEGWTVIKTKNITVLTHASPKYTARLCKAAETCWNWCDKRFSKLNDEYVSRGLIRVCKNYDEYKAYRTGSSDAYSIDDKEIAIYEDKGEGNTGDWGHLPYAIFSHYMSDKDELLSANTPYWLTSALSDYCASARVKGRQIEFRINEYEPEAFRELRRKDAKLMTPKEIMSVTADAMSKARNSKLAPDHQIVTFLRFLEGPGRQHKLLRGRDFLLDYLRASVRATEQYKDAHPAKARKEAETEEEEEARARKDDKSGEKARTAICEAVNKAVCNWSDGDWEGLNKAYQDFLRKLKYL